MTRVPLLAALAAWGLFASGAEAKLNMQPGLWEDQISAADGSLRTEQKCYLQTDIDRMDGFQRGTVAAPDCTVSNYGESGNTITYTLTCAPGGDRSVSEVTATYDGDRTTASMFKGGRTTVLTRKRIGDCSRSSLDK